MQVKVCSVRNPFDGGKADAEYNAYGLGEKVKVFRHNACTVCDAVVVSVGVIPVVVSAAELWVEQLLIVEFSDGYRQQTTGNDVSL